MNIIDMLKSVAKVSPSHKDFENILQLISLGENKLNQLLLKNKLQLLFVKHLEAFNSSSAISEELFASYSNQLLWLQLKYDEYRDLLYNIQNIFSQKRISYAILKGMANNAELYINDHVLYRPFEDMDILILPEQIDEVNAVLHKVGFIQGTYHNSNIVKAPRKDILYWRLNSHQLHEYIRFSKYSYISSYFRLNVDVNTTIFEGGKYADPINISHFLENTIDKSMVSSSCAFTYKTLEYTFDLLQLCYHFYKDTVYEAKKNTGEDYCLLKFCDIREYILKYRTQIDWDRFITIVNDSKIGNQIYYTLKLISSFYKDLCIDDILLKISITEDILSDCIDWKKILL